MNAAITDDIANAAECIILSSQSKANNHIPLTASKMNKIGLNCKDGEAPTFPSQELKLFDHWRGHHSRSLRVGESE